MGRNLGQPDGRFHCLHLAEEGTEAAELMMSPVLEKSGCFWSYLPLARAGRVRQASTWPRTSLMIEVGS